MLLFANHRNPEKKQKGNECCNGLELMPDQNDPSHPLGSFVAFTLVENEHKSKYMLGLKPGLNLREYHRDRNINQEVRFFF
jgi:hypothetical protein